MDYKIARAQKYWGQSSFSHVNFVFGHIFPKLGLVADPVIEAIARLEFEDVLRTGVLHGGCWGP